MDRFSYTQEKVAQEVGKSRPMSPTRFSPLKLPEAVKALVRGQADRRACPYPDRGAGCGARAKEIVEGAFNVRQAEQRSGKAGAKAKPRPEKDADTKALELSLSNRLGLKVQIVDKGDKGGELKIIYSTLEQLDDVIHRLNTAR